MDVIQLSSKERYGVRDENMRVGGKKGKDNDGLCKMDLYVKILHTKVFD